MEGNTERQAELIERFIRTVEKAQLRVTKNMDRQTALIEKLMDLQEANSGLLESLVALAETNHEKH